MVKTFPEPAAAGAATEVVSVVVAVQGVITGNTA
jgi:hypothetical protein